MRSASIYEAIRELSALASGKPCRGPLSNGHVIRPMALHWPMTWYYWPNKPLAVGVEQGELLSGISSIFLAGEGIRVIYVCSVPLRIIIKQVTPL
jgi:hypothetical protein